MVVSRLEQETYFNFNIVEPMLDISQRRSLSDSFNEAEPDAVIATYNASLSRKLLGAMDEHPEIKLVKQNDDGYFEFVVPKKWCKVSIPRVLSDEEKQALREKMLKVNAARFS